MMRALVALVSMVTLAGFSYYGAHIFRNGLAEQLERELHGIEGVQVAFDHFDGTVTGAATWEQEQQVARLLAGKLGAGRLQFANASRPPIDLTFPNSVEPQPYHDDVVATYSELLVQTEASVGQGRFELLTDLAFDDPAMPQQSAPPSVSAPPREQANAAPTQTPLDIAKTTSDPQASDIDLSLPIQHSLANALDDLPVPDETTLDAATQEPQQDAAASNADPLPVAVNMVPEFPRAVVDVPATPFDLPRPDGRNDAILPPTVTGIHNQPAWQTPRVLEVRALPSSASGIGLIATPQPPEDKARLGVYMTGEAGDNIVRYVGKGSAADQSGIRIGDRIERLGPHPISDFQDVAVAVASYHAGDVVSISYQRNDQLHIVDVQLQSSVPTSSTEDQDE